MIQVAGGRPYRSWEDFLASTTVSERRRWCQAKARVANRPRLLSGPVETRLSVHDVVALLEHARGRCQWCGSLALERRPTGPRGKPMPWEHVGRRIGSLDHVHSRYWVGGSNVVDNLAWSCLWCNTWEGQRTPGAVDHGGLQSAFAVPGP